VRDLPLQTTSNNRDAHLHAAQRHHDPTRQRYIMPNPPMAMRTADGTHAVRSHPARSYRQLQLHQPLSRNDQVWRRTPSRLRARSQTPPCVYSIQLCHNITDYPAGDHTGGVTHA
jgi:hypothetical protein